MASHTLGVAYCPFLRRGGAVMFAIHWCIVQAACLTFLLGIPPEGGPAPPDRAQIGRLVRQLGSAKYAERRDAAKRLLDIGEPCVKALREAASRGDDVEGRARARQLADRIVRRMFNEMFQEGVRQEMVARDYRKAVPLFNRAAELGLDIFYPDRSKAPAVNLPALAEVHLHLARIHVKLGDYVQASVNYHDATYYLTYDRQKRQQIDRERSRMATAILADWQKSVRRKVAKDPALRALTAKYPLVFLHTRRYAGGGYLQSAYSFPYQSAEVKQHHNYVQLLFDNGQGDNFLQVNMLTHQTNAVADLGRARFAQDPNLQKVKQNGPRFSAVGAKAVEGHVYLERVQDTDGNHFFVVFQVVAVDPQSRYLAFVWRKLPGGKIVKRR
jgi:hypothetical protein